MKAAVYRQYGGPEVVDVEDIPCPVPCPTDVLIEVYRSTVNRTDTGFRTAEYVISRLFSGLLRPKQPVLGCEMAGVIAEVGTEVSRFKKGDRVMAFNDKLFGGHAEYAVVPETSGVLHIPANLSFDAAACLTEGAHYALFYLRAADIRQGQKWLLNGATGAIGSAAIQLLRHSGAEVTAVTYARHAELATRLGAHRVVVIEETDFTTLNDRFDVVFDAVGKSTFGKCRKILVPKGLYMSTELGPGGQNPWLALWTALRPGKRLKFPLPSTRLEDLEYLADLAAQGHFTPLIDRHFSLSNIREAHRYAQSGQKVGNVVVDVKMN